MKWQTLSASENPFEFVAFFIVLLGYLLAISAQSSTGSYFTILLSGVLLGRLAWQSHGKSKLPFTLLLSAFLVGFLSGNVSGDPTLLTVFLAIGIYYGHEAHQRKYWPFV